MTAKVATPEQRSLEREIRTEAQLVVEGRGPEMFFREMVEVMGLSSSIEVRTFGDMTSRNLRTWLEVFTQKPAFKATVRRLAIIRDAETAAASAAFESVQSTLRALNLAAPEELATFTQRPLSIGVFILPNCHESGMLESLCLEAIREASQPGGPDLLDCVDEFFSCRSKKGLPTPTNPTKARFAGYVLARDVIDPQLGRAAQTRGVIPWDAAAFTPLKAFLRELASPTASP